MVYYYSKMKSMPLHFLSIDGHAVPVGYYDARARELRLVGEGNLWPGTTET